MLQDQFIQLIGLVLHGTNRKDSGSTIYESIQTNYRFH